MQRLGHVTVATSSCVDVSTTNAPIEGRTKGGDSMSSDLPLVNGIKKNFFVSNFRIWKIQIENLAICISLPSPAVLRTLYDIVWQRHYLSNLEYATSIYATYGDETSGN